MKLTAVKKIFRDIPKLASELGLWVQKCRWAGLSGKQFSKDFLVNVDFYREFSFQGNTNPFVLVGMTVKIQNPSESRQFVLLFSFADLTSPTIDVSSYPESTIFMPSNLQGQGALQLAPLDPVFVSKLLSIKETVKILKDKDFTLKYLPVNSNPLRKCNIKDIKLLGGGDTTNSIIKVTLDTPTGFQQVVFKSYLRMFEPNIEAEMITHLHSVGFSAVPALEGSLILLKGGRSYTLLLISQFVENAGDGGKPFWDHLQKYLRAIQSHNDLTPVLQEIGSLAQLIGNTTRDFHKALSKSRKKSFRPEKVDVNDIDEWTREFGEKFANAENLCAQRLPQLFPQLLPQTIAMISKDLSHIGTQLHSRSLIYPSAVITKQRIHGDLHLGQFLFQQKDDTPRFVVTDLEGDPQLPPEKRQEKRMVWFDLGSLLRALDYITFFGAWEILKQFAPSHQWTIEDVFACFFTGFAASPVPPSLEEYRNTWELIVKKATEWGTFVGSQFLQGYGAKESLQDKLPATFKLMRATSELNYELGFRGQNALVPLLGVLKVGKVWMRRIKKKGRDSPSYVPVS
ncbi:MAG: hypothetical protein RBG13Loki_3867 [Promethearchaeota archaeon CR_4]|nr:MAG: hypothetical protein RBG13Loki_3867 [Candidatus Lokiarchaeota archaeon CR_4]